MTQQQPDLSMSGTLRRIRENTGYTLVDLAETVHIPVDRIRAFEDCNLSSQRLLNLYGAMARRTKYHDDRQL